MYKKLLVCLILLAFLSTVLAACSIHESGGDTGPTVHMGSADFKQASITITKGASVTLVDDVSVEHIITNGSWLNSKPVSKAESGAPTYNKTFNGSDSDALGPFTTSGTFNYYCTIHPGMNLKIVVQ